jgi:DNA polymerase
VRGKKIKIITLDVESFFTKDFGFSCMTTEEYIRSPLWETIGVSTKVNDGPIVWVSGDYNCIKAHLDSLPWHNHLLLAQNTAFDGAILNWIYGIKPVGYLDTQSMANALHGVSESSSLANLARLYGETDKGDDTKWAIGKRRLDFTPQELAAYGEYCKHDTELTYNIFHKMLPAFPKAELRVIDLTIRMFCQPQLELDEALLTEDLVNIKRVKRESLEKLVALLKPTPQTLEILIRDGEKGVQEWVKTQVMSNPKFAELLKAQGVEPPTKVSARTGKTAWAFAKTDEGLTDLLDHENPIVSTLVSTRLENKSTIGETRTESFIGVAKRGTYPFSLSYSGAKITHRWSGKDLNPQNLPRGSTLRKAIMAPAGYTLVVADSSAIELRSGLWLAGELDAVQKLRIGIDLYKEFASESFNIPYESIAKTSDERFIGKQGQLSLLYQTGENKLQGTIRIQSKGKITIPLAEAARLKCLYRDKYRYVVDAWDIGEQILQWIYNDESHTAFGLLPIHGKKGILKPSGLYLPFPNLRKENKKEGWGTEWVYDTKKGRATVRDKAYGGKCFQRINQSLARDILATQTMEINKHYWVAGMVHDEVICVVPDAEVEEAKIVIRDIMRTSPDWAKDLPLDCEVGSGKRYGLAK